MDKVLGKEGKIGRYNALSFSIYQINLLDLTFKLVE